MKWCFIAAVLAIFACGYASILSEQVLLKIPSTSGIMHGKTTMKLNKEVREFLGVPYAQPPVGSLRFKLPVEYRGSSIWDATHFRSACFQPSHVPTVISPLLITNRTNYSEDCLYMNIYVPTAEESDSPFPVMVWLSGEGFDFSDPQQFDGGYLAAQGNVIVVTINYRLSAFGFLSAMTEEAPGNAGLYDQRLALKWIKENIENFGGDAQKITLFGRFTGAMSAAIQAFSPLTKEEQLFNRIILQSGIPVGDWVFDRNPLNLTLTLAEKLNCRRSEIEETIRCLREKSAQEILENAMPLPERFRPVFDGRLIVETNSIDKSNFSPVDVMIGLNEDEGSLCSITLKAIHSPLYEKLESDNLSEEELQELLTHNLKSFYKKHDKLSVKLTTNRYKSSVRSPRDTFMKFCGDMYITSHSLKVAEELSKQGVNVYFYKFVHRPTFSIHPSYIRAAHGDDVIFGFGLPLSLKNLTADEAKLTRTVVQAFSNFARKGDPNPLEGKQWARYPSVMTFTARPDLIGEERNEKDSDSVVEFFQELLPAVQGRCDEPVTSSTLSPR